MAKKESLQHTLDRVRAPRVQITYDVEVGDSIEKKEIPFVVGVLGDFSGKPDQPLPKMKDRKFVEVDRDNFNKVLDGMKPRVAFRAANKLANDGTQLAVDLRFSSIDDFSPENVAEQITPLKKLVEARRRLSDLLTKLDGNDKLDELLQDIINNAESLKKLERESGADASGAKKE
jgi:type VI secretion system protein ImpB